MGLGTFGFFWIGDIRVSGLGLDNYDQNEIIKHRWENPWRRLNIENSNKSDFAAKNERIKFFEIIIIVEYVFVLTFLSCW